MVGLHSVAYFMQWVSGLDLLMEQRLKTHQCCHFEFNLIF
jgi:hypothetical protein